MAVDEDAGSALGSNSGGATNDNSTNEEDASSYPTTAESYSGTYKDGAEFYGEQGNGENYVDYTKHVK